MTTKTEMKTLGNLSPARGSNTKKKRLGRGPGSGLGKTAARGGKGQTARKGGGIRAGFEGGQTPLYRRLPKRGFTSPFRVEYNVVNLSVLDKLDAGTKVTPELLRDKGLLRNPANPVKVLGKGELKKKLMVAVHKVSATAKSAIEKAGGSVEVKEK
jgi:large subunit ribosomal protein L15